MPQYDPGRFTQWATRALEQFPVESDQIRFLGHSDNLTFRIESRDGSLYLLRLHYPVVRNARGLRMEEAGIESELTWLYALGEEGGFSVQRPVPALSGNWVSAVEIKSGQNVPATLLTWLPGKHFSPDAPNAHVTAKRLGMLVARLHNFSARWSPPPDFARPRYDDRYFRRLFARLYRGMDLDIFSEREYRTLRASGEAIVAMIEDLPQSPEYHGMIHADLHLGNFLTYNNRLIPIDFSLCGFGSYLFDLSVCATGGLNATLREAFFAGYDALRPLRDEDNQAIQAYALAGRLSYYALQIDNPTERAWLQRRLPLMIQNVCAPFLAGENILGLL